MAGSNNSITVRFNVDGVVEHTENDVQTLTNVVLLDLYKPSGRYGYRFDGWYAESNFTTKIETAAEISYDVSSPTTYYDVYGRFVELNMNNTVQTTDIQRVMYNNEQMLEVVYNDVVVWPLDRAGYDYSEDRHPYLRYCELYDVLQNSNYSYIDTYYPITELDRLKFQLSVNFLNSGQASNGMYYNIPRLQFDIERGMAHWGVGNEYGYSEPIQSNYRIDYMYDITTDPFQVEITQGSYVYTASGHYAKKTISPSVNASIIIFGRRSSDANVLYKYNGYFYEFKMWEDGVLIRDFKPCKLKTDIEANMSYDNTSKRSGTVGAWDLSNNKFVPFTNKSGNERVFNL